MFCRRLTQQTFHNLRLYSTEKSLLAALRKKTGYSFINCKKALEIHNNDIVKVSESRHISMITSVFQMTPISGRKLVTRTSPGARLG